MLSLIPPPYRLLALVALAGALVAFGWIKGANSVQTDWDAATAEQSSVIAAIKTEQAEATVKVVTEYVDRVKVVTRRGADIIKEIPIYVPSDTCTLPAGFRLLHDAAAAGSLPDAAGLADAIPVDAATVAATLADNYTAARLNAEQLTALQEWVTAQTKAGE